MKLGMIKRVLREVAGFCCVKGGLHGLHLWEDYSDKKNRNKHGSLSIYKCILSY